MRSNAGRGPAKSNGTSAMVLGHMWKYHLNFLSFWRDGCSFFLFAFPLVWKTQANHPDWTKRMVSTRLTTWDPRNCSGPINKIPLLKSNFLLITNVLRHLKLLLSYLKIAHYYLTSVFFWWEDRGPTSFLEQTLRVPSGCQVGKTVHNVGRLACMLGLTHSHNQSP